MDGTVGSSGRALTLWSDNLVLSELMAGDEKDSPGVFARITLPNVILAPSMCPTLRLTRLGEVLEALLDDEHVPRSMVDTAGF